MTKLPVLIIKIHYPLESLTIKEIQKGALPYTRYIHCYDGEQDFNERMQAAWRPGATAEVFQVATKSIKQLKAKSKNKWGE